jgi:phage shock protein A
MTTGPMSRLAAALAQSIKQIEADYGEEAREIRAKLAEARAEAEKHEPNSTKLKAILADCNDMVKSVAAHDPAWKAVQRMARLVGLD